MELIEDCFGDVLKFADGVNEPPERVAEVLCRQEGMQKEFDALASELRTKLNDFWKEAQSVIEVHLQDFGGTKCAYGGDIFPHSKQLTVPIAALLTDTVVMPDPLHRVLTQLGNVLRPEDQMYQCIRHAVNVLRLKPYVLAESKFPAVILASGLIAEPGPWAQSAREKDALFHINTATGASFSNIDEAHNWLSQFENASALEQKCVMPERLLANEEWRGNLELRWQKQLEWHRKRAPQVPMKSLAHWIIADAVGRMGQGIAIDERSALMNAIPLVDAPTSWKYLQWKYEYDAARGINPTAPRLLPELVNSLVKEQIALCESLGDLSADFVVTARQSGSANAVREYLRLQVELANAKQSDSARKPSEIVQEFMDNLRSASDAWQQVVADRRRLITKTTPAAVLNAGIGILAVASQSIPLGVAATAANAFLPNLFNVVQDQATIAQRKGKLQKSLFGLLVQQASS